MHPYIPHLITDIEAAHRKDIPEIKSRELTMEEQLEEIERWVSGVGEKPFNHFCGLTADIFPPKSQLNIRDMKLVNQAFLKMMA